MKNFYRIILLTNAFFVLGCGPGVAQTEETHPSSGVKPAPTGEVAGDKASLEGTVLFEGEAPPQTELQMGGNPECRALHPAGTVPGGDVLVSEGKVQNAFVYIKEGLEEQTFEPPQTPVVIDNKTCIYQPHVAGTMVNQPVELRNSDPTLHNVHAYPQKQKQWNVGLPFQGMKLNKTFSEPEIMVKLRCDVHPWMIGYLGVLPHPYFAVTGADGRFELKNLPAGSYTLEAWHERFGTQSQALTIGEGEAQELNFTFRAAAS